ncbi:acetoacetate--CoA ligase [Aestuariivivens sediminis]|uniref:acetoacetate--CoA ligase n=1 Tax=Aestuariivivens sediminis TaxID=2913557 RepID=UPI001F55ABD9|nr:acetoacetate--CoA ligase [Aestuariivivens sediminis]
MRNKKLWEGSDAFKENSHLYEYSKWLSSTHGLQLNSYNALWQWSVDHIEDFWKSIWDYFKVISHKPYNRILTQGNMPDVAWFPGSKLNYAEHIFRHSHLIEETAIIFKNEQGDYLELSWNALRTKVASMATYLKSIGVRKGDCVVAFLPNVPEATISFLAVNSIGGIWSSTSPDFGSESVIDRFAQIKPKVFITVDGYYYNGKPYDKSKVSKTIADALPTLEKVIMLPYLHKNATFKFPKEVINIYDIFKIPGNALVFEPVDFSHPIWVLYSSGTTGLPKAIVHSHGGILLEHLKYLAFHNDVHEGERYFWFTTTGWMMWNFLQSPLLMGATIVLYDGSPTYPDFYKLWQFSEDVKITHFGTSAPFLVAGMKRHIIPKNNCNLTSIRSISSTGAPLPLEAFEYVYNSIKSDVWLCSMAGGTDVCTAFVGGTPFYGVHAGEIQCRALGVSLYAYDDHEQSVVDELGEMVIDKPMPSMPIYFWNDPDNSRYKASYFEHFPGKWRHGDFIKINSQTQGIIIYGRSDATLNRHGIRIGTSEIYRSINKIEAVEDALIVNLEMEDGKHFMPLFVKMRPNIELSEDVKQRINEQLKKEYSPRHVPDTIIEVPDIPYTISGKKMEAPVKKILMHMPLEKSINIDSMKNPESVEFFIAFAKSI